MNKKLLFITDNFPFPPDSDGNTTNIYNIIKHYKTAFPSVGLDLAFFNNSSKMTKLQVAQMRKYCDKIIYIKTNSFVINKCYREINTSCINIFKYKYKTIFFCNIKSGYFIRYFLNNNAKKVFYVADSRPLYYSKLGGGKSYLRYLKFIIAEKLLFKYFDKVIYVSEVDSLYSKQFCNIITKDKLLDIPIGLDKQELFSKDSEVEEKYDLIFTGDLNYQPNIDAVNSLLDDIFPQLILKRPTISICIAGRNPSNKFIEKWSSSKNIVFTGEVDSLTPYIISSKIYVSTLRFGSGMKNKIIHAMSCKKPIVASLESVSGIKHKSGIKIIENESLFAEYIIYLLNDQTQRNHMGSLCYKSFMEHYSWPSVVNKYYSKIL